MNCDDKKKTKRIRSVVRSSVEKQIFKDVGYLIKNEEAKEQVHKVNE